MITRSFDQEDGIIFVTGDGNWSREDVDFHFSALGELLYRLRCDGRPIRILSDVTASQRQHPDIEAEILRQHERLYESGERIAVLVSPSDKSHVITLLGRADVGIFNSRITAEMWLMTPDLAKPA